LGYSLNDNPIFYSQAYNFGPQAQDALSVEQMLKLAINAWGDGAYKLKKEANQPHEAGLLKLDISKVATQLNWYPKMNANQTVKFTLDWYRAFAIDKNQINYFTEHQILSFING